MAVLSFYRMGLNIMMKTIKKSIEIVILTHNRKLYAEKMIESIKENTEYPHKIIIVDNASNEETKEYLRCLMRKNIVSQVFYNQQNLFHQGWQTGIDATEGEMIVLSDPDILVPRLEPCWLTQMVKLMEENPNIGKLGARLDLSNHPSKTWRDKPLSGPSCLNPLPGLPLLSDGKIYRQHVDTTLHIMRKSIYPGGKMQGGLKGGNAGLPRRYLPGTVEAVARDIVVYHLGWEDLKDYPDYFYDKFNNPDVFRSRIEYWNILKSRGLMRYAIKRIYEYLKYRLKVISEKLGSIK